MDQLQPEPHDIAAPPPPRTLPRRARVLHLFKIYRPMFTGEGVFLERCSRYMRTLAPHVEHDLLVINMPQPAQPQPVCSTLDRISWLSRGPMSEWRREIVLVWWFITNLHRYDTVHVRVHSDWYFLVYILTKLAGKRLILSATLDDSVPMWISRYRARLRPLARRLFRIFDGYVSISPRLQSEMVSAVDPAKCHLLPCGIDVPEPDASARGRTRAALGIPDDALVLIFVGGLCRRKDPMLLVEQLPDVLQQRPDTWLLLVGPDLEPDYIAEMKSLIARSGIGDRVIFVGEVLDPHPYFAAADIMTFASTLEGFGTVVPEAMAHGLPVVVRRLPGVNDLFVNHGETGFFFDDAAGYLNAVLRLAADPALRRSLGERARALVQRSFDMRAVARKYLDIYGFRDLGEPPSAAPSSAEAWREAARITASSSVINPRFHSPVVDDPSQPPILLTVIDAEESFDWRLPFSRAATDVSAMAMQHVAHRVFERYGVVPLYAMDYPVATQDGGIRPLRELLQGGHCEVGAQLHPWVNPPFLEEVTARNSYPGSLPLTLEYEKIRALTLAIEDGFGVRPDVYRAGRYGAGPRTGDILKQLGYRVDGSVMPHWDFSQQQGPDFSLIPPRPYWIDADRSIVEIPGSAAVVGLLSPGVPLLRRIVFSEFGGGVGLTSLMARLRLMERIRLTPEGITLREAKRLVRHMLSHDQKLFVLSYHSPSLVPGNTPYVHNQADLERLLRWLDEFYDFFRSEVGGRFMTWRDATDMLFARKDGL